MQNHYQQHMLIFISWVHCQSHNNIQGTYNYVRSSKTTSFTLFRRWRGVTNLVTISGNSSPALSGLIKSAEQKFCPQNETKIQIAVSKTNVIASTIFNITSIGCIVVYTILNTSLAIVTIIMDVLNILAYINNILSINNMLSNCEYTQQNIVDRLTYYLIRSICILLCNNVTI